MRAKTVSIALVGCLFAANSTTAQTNTQPDVPKPEPVPRLLAPTTTEKAFQLFAQGRYAAAQDRLLEAERKYRQVHHLDPTAPVPARELAKIHAAVGRSASAILLANDVLKANPNDAELSLLLGQLYREGNNPSAALKWLQNAERLNAKPDTLDRLALQQQIIEMADAAAEPSRAVEARLAMLQLYTERRAEILGLGLFTEQQIERRIASLYEGIGEAQVQNKQFRLAAAAFDTAAQLYQDKLKANDPARAARLTWHRSGSLMAQGEDAEALLELKKYLTLKPRDFPTFVRFVQLHRKLNRADELPAALEDHTERDPNCLPAHWLQAALLLETDPDAAEKAFSKWLPKINNAAAFDVLVQEVARNRAYPTLLAMLDRTSKQARPADMYNPDRDYKKDMPPADEQAVERARWLSAAVKQLPAAEIEQLLRSAKQSTNRGTNHATDTYELLAGLAQKIGQLEGFISCLNLAVAAEPKNVYLKWLTVNAMSACRMWFEVSRNATSLSRSDNGRYFVGIKAQAAIAFAEMGKFDLAMREWLDLGDTPYTQTYRIRILQIVGRYEDALAACDEVLAVERITAEDQFSIKRLKAETLHLLKRYADAESLLRELLELDPDDPTILNFLGYNLAQEGRKLDEAEQLIRRALALRAYERLRLGDPEATDGNILDSLGWVQFRQGKYEEAYNTLEEVAQLHELSTEGTMWDHLGDAAYRVGKVDRAITAWKQAKKHYATSHVGKIDGRSDEVEWKLKNIR